MLNVLQFKFLYYTMCFKNKIIGGCEENIITHPSKPFAKDMSRNFFLLPIHIDINFRVVELFSFY